MGTTHGDFGRLKDTKAGYLPGPSDDGKTREIKKNHLYLLADPKSLFQTVKSAAWEFQRDNAQRMSAALAYYTIFSVAPLMIIAIAISGLVFGQKAAQGAIVGQIQGFVGPDGAQAIQTMIHSAQRPVHGTIATIVGILALLWGASSVFAEMHDALNTIWDVDENAQSGAWNLVKTRFLSFGMVLAIGFLLLVSLVLSAVLSGVGKYIESRLGVPAAFFHVVDLVVSVMVIAVLFAMIFRVLPNLDIPWSDVWIGATITSILFAIGKFLIGFYIGKSISASAYGAAGSLVILVAWIYYSTLILYFGAEFTHSFSKKFGSQNNEAQLQALPARARPAAAGA